MEQLITQIFSDYAYSPYIVYGAIWLFMILSAFGMPIPEEIVLISAGFIGHMALHPELYPPPYPGATSVNVYVLAAVSFGAVMSSDYLIFAIGRRLGPRLFKMKWFTRLVSQEALERVQTWMRKYGYWTVLIFRFTPGLRFPGHLSCGAMGLSRWRFIAVDTIAAGFSVPTQVILVAFYGQYILQYLTKFKTYLFSTLGIALLLFLLYKLYKYKFRSVAAK
jgi:membrane protein DedA with SNARE-associated domain